MSEVRSRQLPATADVVVIGAGVIGCSSAYHLAEMGIGDIVVLEKGEIGGGASGKSASMLSLQFCHDPLTARLAQYSYGRYMAFEEEMGVPLDFHRSGWLTVATADTARRLREQAQMLQSLGITTEVLTPAEIKHRCPEINVEDIEVGTWGPDDGPFDAHMIISGYVRRARALSVRFVEGVPALAIRTEKGRVTGVTTPAGTIATTTVVNAAGPWAKEVGRLAGVDVPLANSARTIIVTDTLPEIPADYPFVEDLTTEWYFRPEVEGVLMGMGATPPPTLDPPLDEVQLEAIIEVAVHRVPVLERAGLLTAWTGVRPLTSDGQPILGPAPGVDGFWLNAGWGGVGLIQAPVAGRLLAEYLLQGKPSLFDVSALHPERFGDSSLPGDNDL